MKSNLIIKSIIFSIWVVLVCLFAFPRYTDASINKHKISTSYMYNQISRTTDNNALSYSPVVGLAMEYSLQLTQSVGIVTQFNMSLEEEEGSIFYMGGGLGLAWYMLGGANKTYKDTYFKVFSEPRYNLMLVAGLAGRSYDFTAADKRDSDKFNIDTIDTKTQRTGGFLGLMLGVGFEIPIGFFLTPGARIQYVMNFPKETEPAITNLEVWIYSAYSFH